VIVGFAPELDLAVASYFFDPKRNIYAMRQWIILARDSGMWLVAGLVAPAAIAVGLKLLLPHRRMIIPGRAALFLIATLALGPGLVVNLIAKDYWGRPRPLQVQQMGGTDRFVAWWDPRGQCDSNCSFVSGDVSAGFWTMAPAALAPAPWRPLAYAAAIAFGSAIGVMRMLLGAHFFSDVVFAGLITFAIIWVTYNLLYRWRATGRTDDAVEQTLARLARPGFIRSRAPQSSHDSSRAADRDRSS
jgi:membrane-associated PAP2 superfamily phosphatase